jgi:imidazole glycerol-phosphate synthase subunit HisH
MIGIIDVGIGNKGSLRGALDALAVDHYTVTEPSQMSDATHLILPGVGSFAHAMKALDIAGLASAISQFAAEKRPILGICLGMQLLATTGDEHGPSDGLGLIDGRVSLIEGDANHRIPHVGWNELRLSGSHPVLDGLRKGVDFYFVHSYQFLAASPIDVKGTTDHGRDINAIVARENVIGVQFHPEKSQGNGLKILENFCEWDGIC